MYGKKVAFVKSAIRIIIILTTVPCNFLHSRSIKIQIHFSPNQQQINAFLLQLILLFFAVVVVIVVDDDAYDCVGCISLVHFLFSLLSCV